MTETEKARKYLPFEIADEYETHVNHCPGAPVLLLKDWLQAKADEFLKWKNKINE